MKLILSALVLGATLTSAGAQQLHIGTSADYPPWESVDASGQIIGFDRDVGDELCKRMETSCEWQNQAYDGLLPGLQVGKFDLVMSGVSINEERAQRVDFSAAYADAPNAIVVVAGHDAAVSKSAQELVEKLSSSPIGVQSGTTHEQVIRAHFPEADIRVYDRPDQIADDLLAGRIDAGLMERSAWEPLVKERGEGKLVYAGPLLTGTDFPEFGKGQGIALKKGNAELQSKVNEAITSMLKDGTIAAISQKWFAYDISKK
ncbi:transporter substrate-binding domain-containing protein [Pseudochrobactrum asaccharolyticum]|uniref:Amino acid ABC transporter substrate-binding protein (PAAT family) /L-arginine-binding protein n=1 Tax=Pseudochrobactrum asaccharolyticum TaxID=354351 RepID=A0A366DZY0_9HYPH|nr:transporter substrate-binding domain-containing protein [Pseudochrobactrum asaccharolyticum]RBO95670.1 amino acid ABC transporter substrate-binding protein (PAAT family) /L-arginine-binding protein [Pseudochrobactrum asaccharolyticum]